MIKAFILVGILVSVCVADTALKCDCNICGEGSNNTCITDGLCYTEVRQRDNEISYLYSCLNQDQFLPPGDIPFVCRDERIGILCCSEDYCNRDLKPVPRKKTECEQHRDREILSNAPLPMRLIPECDDNGEYKPLQCFQNSEFCACWDKSGNPLTQPSKEVRHCECLAKKIDAEVNPMPGKFKPRCEDDGQYQKHQCHGSTGFCWCAHPETGEETSAPARGPQNCD